MLGQVHLPTMGELHLMQRERLVDRHQELMSKILEDNSHKSKYWILGMAQTKRKNKKTIITPFLKAYDVQPEVRKEAYLYEVDNIARTQTLLWVMHPNNKLALPSINKSINVAGDLA
jgi:hypothetical protein